MGKFGIVLTQRSTWTGFIWILTAMGISLNSEQAEAIATAGMSLAGLLGVFWKD